MAERGRKQQLISGDEYDALTGWRRFLHWRPGKRAEVKRVVNKRERRTVKSWLQDQFDRAEREVAESPSWMFSTRKDKDDAD